MVKSDFRHAWLKKTTIAEKMKTGILRYINSIEIEIGEDGNWYQNSRVFEQDLSSCR